MNHVPRFAAASYSFDLNEEVDGSVTAVALGTVAARDQEIRDELPNNDLTFSITGAGSDKFAVNSAGEVTYVGTGEDYEYGTRTYSLSVSVSDWPGVSVAVPMTINVIDGADTGTLKPPSAVTVVAIGGNRYRAYIAAPAEHADAVWRYAVKFASVDEPSGDPVSATWWENRVAAIDQPTVLTSGRIQYGATYVAVRSQNRQREESEELRVENSEFNNPPAFSAATYSFNIPENADGSSTPVTVGTPTAIDANSNDTLAYSISDAGTQAGFRMEAATGALTYVGTGDNYESLSAPNAAYTFQVSVNDGRYGEDNATVTVAVTDVTEPPGQPTNTRAVHYDDGKVVLTWDNGPNEGPEALHNAYYSYLDATGSEERRYQYIRSYRPGDIKFVVLDLSNARDAQPYVFAESEEGVSDATYFTVTTDGFALPIYSFSIAAGRNGSTVTDGILLGFTYISGQEVPSTDSKIEYSIISGNDAGKFAVDPYGNFSYIGTGETMSDFDSPSEAYRMIVAATGVSAGTAMAEVIVEVTEGTGKR